MIKTDYLSTVWAIFLRLCLRSHILDEVLIFRLLRTKEKKKNLFRSRMFRFFLDHPFYYFFSFPIFLSIRHSHFWTVILPSSSAFVTVYCNRGFHYLKKKLEACRRGCLVLILAFSVLAETNSTKKKCDFFFRPRCRSLFLFSRKRNIFQMFAWHFLNVPLVKLIKE